MNNITFTKMHGAGNDYVYIDCTRQMIERPGELAIRVSDRHFGIGSDGLVLICPSTVADFRMRMFNADGSEAQMCGNASRCVAKYVYDNGLTDQTVFTLETLAGIKSLELFFRDGEVEHVQVDMGVPEFHRPLIALNLAARRMIDLPVAVGGEVFRMTAVSMGNPHTVSFVDDVDSFDLHRFGPMIEQHPLFPERTNVEFVERRLDGSLKMRVWERGAGETMACGTGACAALAAAVETGRADRRATISLPGGDLEIEWDVATGHMLMTGPAETVFEGTLFI